MERERYPAQDGTSKTCEGCPRRVLYVVLQLVLAAIALPLVAQQAGTEVAGAVTVTNKGVAARVNVTNVHLPGRYFLQFSPQVYYLRMAGQDGVYAYSTVTLADRKLPVSISALINQPIQSRIVGGQDFLWNVSLTYSIK